MTICSRQSIYIALGITMLLLTAGCASSGTESKSVSFDGKWELIEMKDTPKFPPDTYLFIHPDLIMYQTSAGCNTFTGNILSEDSSTVFSQPAGTRKFCDELSAFESLYVAQLTRGDNIQIKKNVLHVMQDNIILLAYRKASL